MRNLKLTLFFILMLLTILFPISTNVFADQPEDKMHIIAEEALKGYKEKLEGSKFNFANQEELSQATIGDSIDVYMFDYTILANRATDLKSAMYDVNLVEFIVKSKENPTTRLTLEKSGDTYSRHGFGGSGINLARGIELFKENDKKEIKLVKLGPAEFLYAEKNGKEYLAYIGSTALGEIKPYKKYNAEEILPILQQITQQSISNTENLGGIGNQNAGNSRAIYFTIIGLGLLASVLLFLWYRREGRKSYV